MSSGQGVPTAVAGAKVAALNMSSSSSSSVAADASAAAAATSASSASGSAEGVASTSEGSSAMEVPSPSAASGKKRKKKTKGKGKSKRRRLAELAKKGRENEVFNNLKESNEKEAKHIVSVVFPSKVLSLTQHIEQSAEYNVADLSEIDADLSMCLPGDSEKAEGDEKAEASSSSSSSSSVKPDTSAYKLRNPFGDAPVPDAKVPCNEKVVSMMKWLRKELEEASSMLGKVKLWIQLMVPRMEDGNNFGVAVQEECSGEVGRMEEVVFNMQENMSKYFQTRARIVAKFKKRPHIQDYRQSVVECDHMQYVSLRLSAIELRNHYATLFDVVFKNIDKILQPKNEGGMQHIY